MRPTRRELVAGTLTRLAIPLAAAAQPPKVPRIGWLTNSVVHAVNVAAFREGMRALGYPEVRLEIRAAAGRTDQLAALAAEIVSLDVDVIVTDGGPAALAAKRATAATPIVIGATTVEYLIRERVVDNLARPGGNITGFAISTGVELHGKRLELLREILPTVRRLLVVWNPANAGARVSLQAIVSAADAFAFQSEPLATSDVDALDRRLGTLVGSSTAMLVVTDAFLWSQRARIVAVAARHRIPGMYPEPDYATDGGLIAYGPNVRDNFRRAAGYVDRILKGTKPADLPVEQPTKFEVVINLRTARALGLTIPPSVVLRADQVIE